MVDITTVVEAVITIAVFVLTAFLIPFLRSKMTAQQYVELVQWITTGVRAAEMIFRETGMGEKKKAYVMEFLASLGYDVDEAAINNMVESAVLELKEA